MQIYTLLSPCKSMPYYPHANLYPIIPMQIYTLLSPCKSIPYYPHGMITPPFPVLPIFTTYISFNWSQLTFGCFWLFSNDLWKIYLLKRTARVSMLFQFVPTFIFRLKKQLLISVRKIVWSI